MPAKKAGSKKAKRPVRPSRSAFVLSQARLDERKDAASLESRFLHLPPELGQFWKEQLVQRPFERPLSQYVAVLTRQMVEGDVGLPALSIPKRPKWRYDSTKEHVEKNEEGLFRSWLQELDTQMQIVPEPTFVERNLEVYRQVWRTAEASDVVCVLADARCPLLHFPESLQTYVSTLKPAKPLMLVLTKADLVTQEVVDAWREYYVKTIPGLHIVAMQSYLPPADSGRAYAPGTDDFSLVTFVSTLQRIHQQLCTPHPRVAADSEKLANWKPRVIERVNWAALLGEGGGEKESNGTEDKAYLSIGLIGQPNVGKSSLLNALLGRKAVRASATPGKTKHLQTIFWTPDVRLIDCPGLVSPSRAGLRHQVLASVLPRQAVEACVSLLASYMPLETILGFPSVKTTDDLLTAYADSKLYVTAKAGRPDTSRAGSEILRWFYTAKWAFWPPGSSHPSANGIYLGEPVAQSIDGTSTDEEAEQIAEDDSQASESSSASGSDSEIQEEVATANAFTLLSVD